MNKDKIYLLLIIILSLFLNIYGIWWGIPTDERTNLVFQNKEVVKQLSNKIKELRDEICKIRGENPLAAYTTGGVKKVDEMLSKEKKPIAEVMVDGKKICLTKNDLAYFRHFLINILHPDEIPTYIAISNMDPSRFDFNPHIFIYGGFLIYSVAFALKLVSVLGLITLQNDIIYYFLNPYEIGKFFIIGRLVVALMVVFAIYIIYLIGSSIYDKKTGLIAALLLSITPQVVVLAHHTQPHVFCFPWILLSFYMTTKVFQSERLRFYILGGFFAGLAAGSLYMAGISVFFLPIACFIRKEINWKRIIVHFLLFLMGFLVVNPYWLLTLNEVFCEFNRLPSEYPFQLFSIFSFTKWFSYFKGWAALLELPLLLVLIFGFVYGIYRGVYRREKIDILITLFVLFAFIWAINMGLNYRYVIWIVPFLILWGARAIRITLSSKGKYVVLVFFIFTIVYTGLYSFNLDVRGGSNIRTKAALWINSNIEAGETIGFTTSGSAYFTVPINIKYKAKWSEKGNGEEFINNPPKYFISSELGRIPKIIETNYTEIKRFDERRFIIELISRNVQKEWVWFDPCPIVIYKRN